MTINELISKNDGSRFQAELSKFIFDHNLKTIVETGMGVSSIFILGGFDLMSSSTQDHHLYSIDPNAWFPDRFEHPKHTLIEDKSIPALLELYLKIGSFDLFLHDGEHEIKCQEYEYEFAYQCLKPGGYIASDDICWGNNTCWPDFIKRNNLTDEILGAIRIAQKPFDAPVLGVDYDFAFGDPRRIFNESLVHGFHNKWLGHCEKLEKEWLAAGNKKHPAFE